MLLLPLNSAVLRQAAFSLLTLLLLFFDVCGLKTDMFKEKSNIHCVRENGNYTQLFFIHHQDFLLLRFHIIHLYCLKNKVLKAYHTRA